MTSRREFNSFLLVGTLLYSERYFSRNNLDISLVPFASPIGLDIDLLVGLIFLISVQKLLLFPKLAAIFCFRVSEFQTFFFTRTNRIMIAVFSSPRDVINSTTSRLTGFTPYPVPEKYV